MKCERRAWREGRGEGREGEGGRIESGGEAGEWKNKKGKVKGVMEEKEGRKEMECGVRE